MTAPTSPYCTSADVALLIPNLVKGATDFSTSTTPTKTAVENLISKWSYQIDAAFAQVGYYVPFEEYDSETWPTWQTGVLLLANALAVAGVVAGPVVKPAPAIGGRSGTSDNAFTAEFKEMLSEVKRSGLGVRARIRTGSPAEEFIHSPMGPMTDYLMGYIDETEFQTATEYTTMIQVVRGDYMVGLGRRAWDHLAARRRELIGI